ncbi:hypothetical protein EYF80_027411 [Liparis tanakae]|uniref:Uncharacterized protein n=1 Tax=Liparis tanakae TaxID=230148 RepID=A0A4Z2HA57_9TELE|nr:hypothetical protein EYF80_027411 [Liparis tanakae]
MLDSTLSPRSRLRRGDARRNAGDVLTRFDGPHMSCLGSSEGGAEDEAFLESQRPVESLWRGGPGARLTHRSVIAAIT